MTTQFKRIWRRKRRSFRQRPRLRPLNSTLSSPESPHRLMGLQASRRAQIGDLVGPASGELTTVSTIDPIKAYYNVTEQAYINFTKSFSSEAERYEQLKRLDIEL